MLLVSYDSPLNAVDGQSHVHVTYLNIIFYKFTLIEQAPPVMCAVRTTVWLLVQIVWKVQKCKKSMGTFYIYIGIMICVVACLQRK
jgi:hypothetical protein